MYPHHKLDWHLSRLETRLDAAPDDASARLDYAEHCLSKARFHDGGEPWYNRALTQSKRILGADPSSVGAQVIAGLALVGLDRIEPASRYLDSALRDHQDRADVHYGLGAMHRARRDFHGALREFEIATRLAPESFETHHALALVLWARARQIGTPIRLVERSQFHATQALDLDPTPRIAAELRFHLGMTALHLSRWSEAHGVLSLLADDDHHGPRIRYHLGVAAYHLGKYKNAILHLRQHLERAPEDPKVHARIGMAYLQLGEVAKARTACNRALAVDPTNVDARWTLGCALLEEGQDSEAAGVLKDLLRDAPDHVPAFTELVRLRKRNRDMDWLRTALRNEVSGFDRLPVRAILDGQREVTPRSATRNRIAILLQALGTADDDAIPTLLATMALTTDESVRFLLWEASLQFAAIEVGKDVIDHLEKPGTRFDADVAVELLAVADLIPEDLLSGGLAVGEDDLNRAAVDRYGPARDLKLHRERIEAERLTARAWQALLLLALGHRNTDHGRNLLKRWAADADRDLVIAARAALTIQGDEDAVQPLRNDARKRRAEFLVDRILAGRTPTDEHFQPRPVSDASDAHCATCGRTVGDVDHLLQGADAHVCNRCITEIATRRRSLVVDDPAARCALCHRSGTEVRAIFDHRAVKVCSKCVDQSLGLTEREAVDRFFVSLPAR